MNNRTLILMRHAKSSWANASLSDFDRPLNHRGRKTVPVISEWLKKMSLYPDCLLCSTAVRAQQTAEILGSAWKQAYTKIDLQELYLASPNTILQAIDKHAPEDSQTLLLIGHNPGLEELASMLSGRAIVMPTAAIAVFRLLSGESWAIDLSERHLQFEHFIAPREIQTSFDPD